MFRDIVANALPVHAFFIEDSYFFLNTGTTQINDYWLCTLASSPHD